jgi:hypothetical protein
LLGNSLAPDGQIVETITIEVSELKKAIVFGVFVSTHGIVAANQDFSAFFAPRPYYPFSLTRIKIHHVRNDVCCLLFSREILEGLRFPAQVSAF